jgi:predicted Zn-dependent protease
MKASIFNRLMILILAVAIMSPATMLAADEKSSKADEKASKDSKPADPAAAGKLKDDENPTLIGKRNINKHQINFYSLEKEVNLGRQISVQVDQQAKFIDDPVITEYVNRVGQNIALHSDAKIPFTIKVLDSDDVNAFALPGGFLYVNKGVILAADTEAELAGVMAHEIAHVAARHGVEQASKATLANYAMIPLIFMSGGLGAIAYNAAQIGVPLAFLKFGRGAESEADKLGAQYLWAAGYDPHYFMTFFEKLDKKEKSKPGTLSKLFGTHPPTGDRAVKVRDLLTRFPDREEYTLSTSEFSRVKSRLLAISNAKTINANGERDTGPKRPTLKRRQDADPNAPTTSGEEQTTKDRPTLKRRDSDGKPPEKKP